MRTIDLLRRNRSPEFDRNKYRRFIKTLIKKHGLNTAMRMAPGGEFEAMGILERELLIHSGLDTNAYLIDVGCGSGRLAYQLRDYLRGRYLGIDIVPEVVAYARKLVSRPDWRFEVTGGLSIPEKDCRADMVTFFSVFTHMLHEESYRYLREAKRVLKPGGKIVFSFLDYGIPSHWPLFEAVMTRTYNGSSPPNVFLGREAIMAWARHLNLTMLAIEDGDTSYIPLSHPVALENGTIQNDRGSLGQSVCVLAVSS